MVVIVCPHVCAEVLFCEIVIGSRATRLSNPLVKKWCRVDVLGNVEDALLYVCLWIGNENRDTVKNGVYFFALRTIQMSLFNVGSSLLCNLKNEFVFGTTVCLTYNTDGGKVMEMIF